jgi:hypothetical protein
MARSRNTADTQTASGGPVSPSIAGKNIVHNGGFDIWQRGTSIVANQAFGPDRWYGYTDSTANRTTSRQATGDTTNLPNIQYCMRFQRTAGDTSLSRLLLGQTIESVNSIPFAGKVVTLSFYARAGANYSASGSGLGVTLKTGTGIDGTVFNPFTGAVTQVGVTPILTTTWQRVTSTFTMPTNAQQIGLYMGYTPTGTAGTNDYFEMTGVQVELGSVATPFSRAGGDIQGELAACQRYYYQLGYLDIPAAYAGTTTTTTCIVRFPVQMRTAPTGISVSTVGDWRVYNAVGGFGTSTAITFNNGFTTGTLITVTTTAGSPTLTAGSGGFLYGVNPTAAIGFTGAEL